MQWRNTTLRHPHSFIEWWIAEMAFYPSFRFHLLLPLLVLLSELCSFIALGLSVVFVCSLAANPTSPSFGCSDIASLVIVLVPLLTAVLFRFAFVDLSIRCDDALVPATVVTTIRRRRLDDDTTGGSVLLFDDVVIVLFRVRVSPLRNRVTRASCASKSILCFSIVVIKSWCFSTCAIHILQIVFGSGSFGAIWNKHQNITSNECDWLMMKGGVGDNSYSPSQEDMRWFFWLNHVSGLDHRRYGSQYDAFPNTNDTKIPWHTPPRYYPLYSDRLKFTCPIWNGNFCSSSETKMRQKYETVTACGKSNLFNNKLNATFSLHKSK